MTVKIKPMLSVATGFAEVFSRLGLRTCAEVVARFRGNETSTRAKFRIVKQAALPVAGGASIPVFFKLYEYTPPSWEFVGRASKAFCEYRNYERLERLGVRAAERVACGEERDWLGRLRQSFIITRAVPQALALTELFIGPAADRTRPEIRRLRLQIVRQLAEMVRRCHAAGFFHRDLFWRNILVTLERPDEARLWWIDCPRGCFERVFAHRLRLRDLASVDTGATVNCTRGERLEFLKTYLGKTRVDARMKQLAEATADYRIRHWPEGVSPDLPTPEKACQAPTLP